MYNNDQSTTVRKQLKTVIMCSLNIDIYSSHIYQLIFIDLMVNSILHRVKTQVKFIDAYDIIYDAHMEIHVQYSCQ